MESENSKERLAYLSFKYLNNTITPQEKEEFEKWYNEPALRIVEIPEEISQSEDEHADKIFASILVEIHRERKPTFRLWFKLAAVAILTLAVSTSLYFILYKRVGKDNSQIVEQTIIQPGGNKAVLTLANGKKISLDDKKEGSLAIQDGIRIEKTDDGQLVYHIDDAIAKNNQVESGSIAYNTIETPNGGQYQVILQDGTKVWLNASTKLKYPLIFKGKNRLVELEGEAYFEVAENKKQPFVVNTANQSIEVLGTHFNLNSYPDEGTTKTTLLKGSVKVISAGRSMILQPGEQAQLIHEKIKVTPVDVEQEVAWKNGYFQFDKADVKELMRQIARWYDVEVEYKGDFPEKEFSGKIERHVTAQELIEALNFYGIKCRIKEGKIIVKP